MDRQINSIYKVSILSAVIMLFVFGLKGQDLYTDKVKEENSLIQKFHFEVINKSTALKYYSVSLEKYGSDGLWHEVKGDVFGKAPTKTSRILKVKGNETTRHFFDPRIVVVNKCEQCTYRLKVKYGNGLTDRPMIHYSKSFAFH